MNLQVTVTEFIFFLIAGMLLFLAAVVGQYRDKRAGRPLTLLLFLLGWWAIGYGRELTFHDLAPILFWVRLEYVAIVFVPVSWLYFVLQYGGYSTRAVYRLIAISVIIPVIALVGVWTNDFHHLFYKQIFLQNVEPFTLFKPVYGPLFWLDILYNYAMLIAGMLVTLRMWVNSQGLQRKRLALIFAGALIPVLANIPTLLQIELPFHLHWTPVTFSLTGILTFWAVKNFHLLDLAPIARNQVLEQMKVALFVLDADNRIVDLNQAACHLAGMNYDQGFGKSLPELMPEVMDWARILDSEENRVAEAALPVDSFVRTYEIRVTPLTGRGEIFLGQTVVMTDMTQRKLFERNLWETNELLEHMFSSLHYLVVFMDREFNYIKVNQAYADLVGKKPEEMVGLHHFHFMDIVALRPAFQEVIDTGTSYTVEGRPYILPSGQGQGIYWDWSAQAVHEENGEISGLVLTMMDVTRRELAALALRESEQKYRILAENTYDWEFWAGPDGEFVYISPACKRISGYEPQEFRQNPHLIENIIAPEDLDLYRAHHKITAVDRQPVEIQFRIRHKKGEVVWLAHSCRPIFTEEGVYIGNRGNNQDVTEKRRVEEVIRRRAVELEALYETSLELNGQKDTQALLTAIVHRVTNLVGAPMAGIFLLNEDQTELELVIGYNLPPSTNKLRVKVGEGVTGTVAATGNTLNIDDYQTDENWSSRNNFFSARRFLSVPMMWNGKVIGVIDVADNELTGAFSVDNLHLVSLFANQAAIAIRNAKEFDRLWQQATTDTLTGLDNRRRFMDLAGDAWELAVHKKKPLAVLMMDIDNFKSFNDRWGHQLGDMILIQVAEIIRSCLRGEDIIGRFGGEEFIAILPAIQLEQAQKVAERLVSALNENPLTIRGKLYPVSISIGVSGGNLPSASFPSLEQLIKHADQALYVAKRSGRNQARVYRSNLPPLTTLPS